jgi:hypothetical protein
VTVNIRSLRSSSSLVVANARCCGSVLPRRASIGQSSAVATEINATQRVAPFLYYDDVATALDWLCTSFGFIERFRLAGRAGVVHHAELSFGDRMYSAVDLEGHEWYFAQARQRRLARRTPRGGSICRSARLTHVRSASRRDTLVR